jgi:purine-binding chemotaxis protein CheW
VIGLDGKTVPVFSIPARLGLPARAPRLSDRLIIAQGRRRVRALPVDTVRGVEHLAGETIFAADAPFCGDWTIAGVAFFDAGTLLIHDLDRFLSINEEKAHR